MTFLFLFGMQFNSDFSFTWKEKLEFHLVSDTSLMGINSFLPDCLTCAVTNVLVIFPSSGTSGNHTAERVHKGLFWIFRYNKRPADYV